MPLFEWGLSSIIFHRASIVCWVTNVEERSEQGTSSTLNWLRWNCWKQFKSVWWEGALLPPMFALNGHGNPCMLKQFSNHCAKLFRWELKMMWRWDEKNVTMDNRWNGGKEGSD